MNYTRVFLVTTDGINTRLFPEKDCNCESIIDYGIEHYGLDFVGYTYSYEEARDLLATNDEVFGRMSNHFETIEFLEKCLSR